MALTVLVIDEVGEASNSARSSGERLQTLLSLPLGTGSVLDNIAHRLAPLLERELLVTLPEGPSEDLDGALRRTSSCAFKALGPAELRKTLAELETSDRLLLIRARDWPTGGYEPEGIRQAMADYHGATYGVAVGADKENTRELVERDADGRVRRVQRFYDIVSWPETACHSVVYALLPGHALRQVPSHELADIRLALTRRGMLGRDVPLHSERLDLSVATGFLAAHEQVLEKTVSGEVPDGYTVYGRGVWVAQGAWIHPTARLVGPLVVQDGCVVSGESTIIGPAVLGRDTQIGRGAAVAHSVLAAGTSIPAKATVRHQRVLAGEHGEGPSAVDLTFQLRSSGAGYVRSEEYIRQLEERHGRRDRLQRQMKRAFDLAAAATGLILLAPLLVLIAVAIRLDTPGPILFGHRRECKGGKQFRCFKFRTMVTNADQIQRELYKNNEVDGPQFKMRSDPRVTRVGWWLRATNLDELPQLINVLLGHMSLVGPRPSPFRENQICVPWRRARLSVRPGITGLWQVCRGEDRSSDFHQWIFYDITYVRNFSLWLDLKILAATVLTLGGKWSVPLRWMIRDTGKHQPSKITPPQEELTAA